MREWLRDLRHGMGLTEKQVADAVNIKQPVYHRYETGEGNPKVRTAKKIGIVLGFDWTKFYEDKGA